MSTDQTIVADAIESARLLAYRFLEVACSDPRSARWNRLRDATFTRAAMSAAQFLSDEPTCAPGELAPGETTPSALDFAALVQLVRNRRVDVNSQYEQVFGLMMSKKCPPYETEYCPQTFSVYRSQALADIAGYYRAFGLEPSRDMPERVDHISLELGFMAWLIAKEQRAANAEQRDVCREAQRRFVRDHLAWWVPAFARALRRQSERIFSVSNANFYALLAQNLAAFIPVERAALDVTPPKELVAPGPIEPHEEMSCSSCAGSCEPSNSRS